MSQKGEHAALESHSLGPRDLANRYGAQARWWTECIIAVLGARDTEKYVSFLYTSLRVLRMGVKTRRNHSL